MAWPQAESVSGGAGWWADVFPEVLWDPRCTLPSHFTFLIVEPQGNLTKGRSASCRCFRSCSWLCRHVHSGIQGGAPGGRRWPGSPASGCSDLEVPTRASLHPGPPSPCLGRINRSVLGFSIQTTGITVRSGASQPRALPVGREPPFLAKDQSLVKHGHRLHHVWNP